MDATGLATVFHYDYPSYPYLVTSIDDPYSRTSTFAYTVVAGAPHLQSTEDPFGIISSFAYDAVGQVAGLTTPYGTTTFKLSDPYVDRLGMFRFVEVTDGLGQTERVEYNVNAPGVPATLETPQPSSSIVNFQTSYNIYRNTFYWDKLAMKLAPGDYLKAHRYHWLHLDLNTTGPVLESEIPALEGRIFYNYPGQTNPVFLGTLASPSVIARVVKDASGANQTQATKYEYNAQGNVTKKTDPMGRATLTEYATNGTDVLDVKQQTGTSGGSPVWTTLSSFTYGTGTGSAPHRPATMTDGAGQTTTYTYTATGQTATIQNAKSETTTFTYETSTSSPAYDHVLSITGDVPGGNRSFTYDSAGRLATTTDSEGYVLTYDYDDLDRLRTITYPDSSFEQFEYADQSLIAQRDREGRWTRHMYNPLAQKILTQDAALRRTQFEWCRCGKLKRFVDGNGNITEWQRDEGSRITKKIEADGTFSTNTYDFSGRLATEVDAQGRTITYSYATDDRILKKDYSDTATPDVTYTYDTWFPRLATRVDGAGTTSFAYYTYGTSTLGAGRLSLENGPLTDDTLKHTYDELGREKKLQIVDDATQTTASYSEEYTFDTRARVTGVQNGLGISTYTFVGQSNRTSTASFPNGMQTLYDYYTATGDFMLKQIKNLSSGTTPSIISQFDYTYRQDRSIDTWTINQGSGATTWSFGYDAAKQLTAATLRDATLTVLESDTYAYDNAGNRTQVGNGTSAPNNFSVNALNQLLSQRDFGQTTFAGFVDEPSVVKVNGKAAKVTSTDGGAPFKFEAVVDLDAGANSVVVEAKDGRNNVSTKTYSLPTSGTSKTFEYDSTGNLRYDKQPSGSINREYRWDQQNRLVKTIIGSHESDYFYDGESRRFKIQEFESGLQTKERSFIWCGAHICQKRNGASVERNYFAEGFEDTGPVRYFYTHDHLGSVREVVGNDGTSIASQVSYNPWGKPSWTGSGSFADFSFTGDYFEQSTGNTFTLFRVYDSDQGRWLSRDPLGLAGGLNLYDYVENNPIAFTDPLGLDPLACFPLAAGPPPIPDPCRYGKLYCYSACYARAVRQAALCVLRDLQVDCHLMFAQWVNDCSNECIQCPIP